MVTSVADLLKALENNTVVFDDVLSFINTHYVFTATAFKNGNVDNSAEENQGSCRVFAFAQLHSLNHAQTLSLFAEHYQNVLDNPDADNHQNIRQFMDKSWDGLTITNQALKHL